VVLLGSKRGAFSSSFLAGFLEQGIGMDEAHYWQQKRQEFVAKNDILSNEPNYRFWDPLDFYRFIFPEGFLQECWTDADDDADPISHNGKPNAIALLFTDKLRERSLSDGSIKQIPVVERRTVTDELDVISDIISESVQNNFPAYMAPVSWFGKHNRAKNARYLHAFTVDLDGVTPENLKGSIFKQIRNGREADAWGQSIPQPTFIVNSGQGLHLYYVLEKPLPLFADTREFMKRLKYALIDVVWNDYTTELGRLRRQYQGVYQGFRMPGTSTKLNGFGEEAKTSPAKYVATAFAYEPNGKPERVSLEYLLSYTAVRGEEIPHQLLNYLDNEPIPLEIAKKRWPNWYERRILNGEPRGYWKNSRALYDWWLKRIPVDAVYHGRYWSVFGLVSYAKKCGIPYEEVECDALGLVETLDKITETPENHFTEYDVICALSKYDDDDLTTITRDFISRKSMIRIDPNKRNGRRRELHLRLCRANLEVLNADNGSALQGRPKGSGEKKQQVYEWRQSNPEGNKSQCAKDTGFSRTTVIKWWDWVPAE
jgi:hypothetical protein